VLDVYSGRIIGWSMSGNRKTDLVVDAVAMAVARRGGNVAGVIRDSDHGGGYSSHDLHRALRAAAITASMGSVRGLLRHSVMIMSVGVGSLVGPVLRLADREGLTLRTTGGLSCQRVDQSARRPDVHTSSRGLAS
jgi:hypothetical protein